MTAKSFLLICVVGVSSIGVASAKSYYFTLTSPTKAGATVLKAGDYEVNVKGDQAVFTNNGGKSVSVPVKVEQSDKKYDATSVDTNSDAIKEIHLGGSATKLTFGQ
jgi:hypothetical protein